MRRLMLAVPFVLLVVQAPPGAASHQGEPILPIVEVVVAPWIHPGDEAPLPSLQPQTQVVTTRQTADQPDPANIDGRKMIHGIYFVPSGRDRQYDINGSLQNSFASFDNWFVREAGRAFRIDRLTTGEYDITFVAADQPMSSYRGIGSIRTELIAKGFNLPNKRYLVWAEIATGGVCGSAYYGPDEKYTGVYLRSVAGCGATDFGDGTAAGARVSEVISAHEIMHNEGVASMLAPHHCAIASAHLCTGPLALFGSLDPEEVDLIFPFITGRPLSTKVLDRGHDDYFRHPFPYRDLDSSLYFM